MFVFISLGLESRACNWVPGPLLPAALGQGTTDVRRRIQSVLPQRSGTRLVT